MSHPDEAPDAMASDPSRAQPAEEAPKTDVLGNVADTIELGGLMADAAVLAAQMGGLAVEAGAATLEVAAAGAEAVGSLVAGVFEGL
jgi:hypothetical protein